MNTLFAPDYLDEYEGPSIFLAGPTIRQRLSGDITRWRRQALNLLQMYKYRGDVFFPEVEPGGRFNYGRERQYDWEDFHLNSASCILFWIPRDLKTLPAFTTNIEWGKWHDSGKVVLGAPLNAPKMSYIRYDAAKCAVPIEDELGDAIQTAIAMSERLSHP